MQRQKTLLKEYEQSTKSSTFVDKRIGEQNEGLEEFDKAILRSQRERQVKFLKALTLSVQVNPVGLIRNITLLLSKSNLGNSNNQRMHIPKYSTRNFWGEMKLELSSPAVFFFFV